MNKVFLCGRLTADPETRYGKTGMAVCTFSVALDRGRDKDGNSRGADFPRVKVFGKQAEICERFLAKGSRVLIEGRIATGSYEGQDGNRVFTTEVVANFVEFFDRKPQEQIDGEKRERRELEAVNDEIPEGFIPSNDIPF